MVKIVQRGGFSNLERFFNKVLRKDYLNVLDYYGRLGVEALRSATPIDSGETAASWDFDIRKGDGYISIAWTNSSTNDGFPIAIMLQYGHGTGSGGYVQGIDYINPAMRPLFEEIAERVWREVTT